MSKKLKAVCVAPVCSSRSKAEELQAQRIARSETLGEAVRVRRKEMKELAEKFACAVAEIDEKFSKSSGLSYGSS